MKLSEQLDEALTSEGSLLKWFERRGYEPKDLGLPLPSKQILSGAKYLASGEAEKAPRILYLWRESFAARAVHGEHLRQIQIEANAFRDILVAEGYESSAPNLTAIGCSHFLIFFPLNGDPFARRLRFTADQLDKTDGALAEHYRQLNAQTMAEWAKTPDESPDELLSDILGDDAGVTEYDFSELFVGVQLDDDFVAFMGHVRRHIVSLVLDRDRRSELLVPLLERLHVRDEDAEYAVEDDGYPTLASLAKLGRLRNRLIAVVDTVLLRLVLYRYLEAQFGYQFEDDEAQEIAFGSYDEILDRTTRVDAKKLDSLLKHARKTYRSPDSNDGTLLSLFAPAVEVTEPEKFAKEVRAHAEFYQGAAGGDLHQGEVADAANILQQYLLEEYSDATLLEGTRSDRYSFNYADLDPRAFQRFYEDTIGTDIRLKYDPTNEDVELGVVQWHKNRKEQGAYFTHETMCHWLIERTLGRRFAEWKERFHTFLLENSREPKGRMPRLRAFLDELLQWRILDPTCGGGIFLRTAFEFLSQRRSEIEELLSVHLPEEVFRELTSEEPYSLFGPKAETGEWEWYILLHMLYGVDVDVKAINVASNLLTLSSLTYKPHGVCFPSFINVNLKQGNALVVPMKPEQREAFADAWGDQIRDLIKLRRELRNPNLGREEWRELHQKAQTITTEVLHAQIILTFQDIFPDLHNGDLIERVLRVGAFLYEIEFPEVFFNDDGTWRENPGFDVVVGNPPWEEPAYEYKHFLPEFDPEYGQLSGQASKLREKELLSDPEIKRRWEVFKDSVEDYKALLKASFYEYQSVPVQGRVPGAHSNLYKYATEMVYRVLRNGGDAGMVIDNGLWSDLSSKGLRKLLLDNCNVSAACGFTNRQGLFVDVHPRQGFSCTVFRKGRDTEILPAIFMRESFSDLDHFDEIAVEMDAEFIRTHRSDSYPVPGVRSQEHWLAKRALESHPSLNESPWSIDTYSRELNAGEQRHFFHPEQEPGYYPLVQGTQFNLFGVHQGELPELWVNPSDDEAGGFLKGKQERRVLLQIGDWLAEQRGGLSGGKKAAARKWLKSLTGEPKLPEEWLKLDWDSYRIAWRDIARNDDRRTLIPAIVPPHVGLSGVAPYVRPFKVSIDSNGLDWQPQYRPEQLLYLAGMLSSFACDSLARTRVAKTHLTTTTFRSFEVPIWEATHAQRRVAELTAKLTCLPATPDRPWADYTDLAEANGQTPDIDALTDPAERREAEIELNALAAEIYGLDRQEFGFLMNELFMTPKHKDTHERMRDDIATQIPDLPN